MHGCDFQTAYTTNQTTRPDDRIVLKPSLRAAWVIVAFFMVPSFGCLWLPFGGWLFLVAALIGAVLGWEVAKTQVLNRSKASIVCIIPPHESFKDWVIVFQAGFTQQLSRVHFTSVAGILWMRVGAHTCLITRERVNPSHWAWLHRCWHEQVSKSYASPPAEGSDNPQ